MFVKILCYKCELNRIEAVKANRFYPSSKKCSCCGEIKKDLKLKDRVFICPTCGYTLDRDKNASINGVSQMKQKIKFHTLPVFWKYAEKH